MTDATIVTLAADYPSDAWDPYWTDKNLADAQKRVAENVPSRYADAVVTVPEVADWVRRLIDQAAKSKRSWSLGVASVDTGPSLLLVGPTGTGKTYQAYGAIRALAMTGVGCRWVFTTAADAYARLRPRHRVDSEEEFNGLANAQLLVIDDLGAAKNSEWVEEVNYRLINHRYEHERPTLITSNVLPRELGSAIGERVASRLIEMTERVTLKGEDRRRTNRKVA